MSTQRIVGMIFTVVAVAVSIIWVVPMINKAIWPDGRQV